jgi:hypothetical protein
VPQTVDHSKFLSSELPFHGWENPEIACGEIWTVWRCSNGVTLIHFFPRRTQNSI